MGDCSPRLFGSPSLQTVRGLQSVVDQLQRYFPAASGNLLLPEVRFGVYWRQAICLPVKVYRVAVVSPWRVKGAPWSDGGCFIPM